MFEKYREVIPGFLQLQKTLCQPLPTHLRVNRLKINPGRLVSLMEEKGICLKKSCDKDETMYIAPGLDSPGNMLEYFLGFFHPQAFTSCLASIALSPKKDSYVLDMCASPGGKTSHIAQLMENTGLIVANELYPSRHSSLGHTLERLGVLNTVITGYQAQEFPLKQHFDFILADVPCSGEGGFRKTSATSRYKEISARYLLPELQKKIVVRGFDLLTTNGVMLYSTCTYNPEENESVVSFLLENREAKLLPINVGFDYDPGITQWRNKKYDKRLERTARFYPHRCDSVGFFMARIGKRG
jgi:NOL1/NOP2/sun family putative RNA methylase